MEPSEFWSIGDYAIVGDLWSAPGRELAESLDVAGLDVIDIATGTGVTAIAMAQQGARSIVGVDATPELLAEATKRADNAGLEVSWIEADMASVPLPDGSADVVTSTFGVIFASDPDAAIAECRRLVRPGGQIVLTSWAADGLFGQLRMALSPYFPEADEPWHEQPKNIREILGSDAIVVERSFDLTVASPQVFVSQLEQHSAPFVLGAQALGNRWQQAKADLIDVVSAAGQTDGDRHVAEVSYLVSTVNVR